MKPGQRPTRDPPPPFVPSEDWIDAFDTQCTEPMMKRAKRFVARRVRGLGGDSAANDTYYADELVMNAVTDTALGVLQWDPAARSLYLHIRNAVRLRIKRDRAHAERYPHESLDALSTDGDSPALEDAEASLLAAAHDATPETIARAAETMTELRRLAARDRPVLRLLDAIEEGATDKADIMRIANLSSAGYHNARRRLARFVAQLPRHLQPNRTILAKGA